MNAECREIRPLLSAYMDNDLTPDELRVVQAHVARCQECAAVLREYRQLRSAVRSLSQPLPPPELRAAVFARATPAYRRRAALLAFGQRGLSYAAMAATVIVLLFTAALLLRGGAGRGLGTADTTPPRIVDLSPEPGTPDWSLDAPVRITFSKPMDQASVLAALDISANPPLREDERQRLIRSATWQGNTLIVGAGAQFRPYTDYTITIDAGRARDQAQNALQAVDNRYTFRTVDIVVAPPTATAVAAAAPSVPTPTAPPPAAPTQTERPTEGPAPPVTPAPMVTAPAAAPTGASAQAPPPTKAPPPAVPAPTATPVPPTATPRPTATSTPTNTPVPSPTARPTEPPPTATPAKSPYAAGKSFAAYYDGNAALAERLGPPTANEAAVSGSYLAFERGWMLYRADTRTIYVLFNEDPRVWYAFADGWSEGMEPGGGPADKPGLFKPMYGFGGVWSGNAEVQRRLGFALSATEIGGTIAVQPYERGLLIASDLGAPFVYVLYQNNLFERIAR